MEAVAESPGRRLARRRLIAACAAGLAAAGGLAATLAFAAPHPQPRAPTATAAPAPGSWAPQRPHPRVELAVAPGEAAPAADTASSPTSAADSSPQTPARQSDAEIRSELTAFRRDLAKLAPVRGVPGTVLANGTAVTPTSAPPVVAAVIAAGNEIATKPYLWGGGHGGWADSGYDCSGSVSFALAGAGLLSAPMVSTDFMTWGDPGPGRWITIYASPSHVWMIVGNLRFDTSGETAGTRWQQPQRSTAGFAVRHPPGL